METKIGLLKKNIANSFTRIGDYLTFTNSAGYTDFNSDAERFFIAILNKTFGYSLRELNVERPNFPAIDLADDIKRVCFQVTTMGGNFKYKETLATYKRHGFTEKYDELIFLILSSSHKLTITDKEVTTKTLTLTDLYIAICSLGDQDIEFIDSYLKDYLRERESVDNSPKPGVLYTLGSAKKFIKWSNRDDEDLLAKDLKAFALTLSELTSPQRAYLHFLVSKGHTPTNGHYYERADHIVVPSALERAHYDDNYYLFNSLKALKLVYLDDEYDQHGDERYVTAILPRFRGEAEDYNLFAKIKQFVNGDASELRKIFLHCDFSSLD